MLVTSCIVCFLLCCVCLSWRTVCFVCHTISLNIASNYIYSNESSNVVFSVRAPHFSGFRSAEPLR